MRISIIGDVHCGYAWGEERGGDSFAALEECIQNSKDADLIILAGDIFDTRLPKQEVFARAAKIIAQAKTFQSNTKLLESKGKAEISPLALRGVPVLAIHGNHDRRSKHLINPVQSLEHAGLLIHMHGSTLLFDCSGTKVAVHGLSNVPERYAKEAMLAWAPKPVPNALNILVVHQSIDPYIYSPLEPPTVKLEDLPDGFQLIVNGHIHWHDRRLVKGNAFLVTGSVSPTAIGKYEADQRKVFWQWDGSQLVQVPLKSQRKIFWEEFEWSPDVKEKINARLEQLIKENEDAQPKPIVAAKVRGKLPVGVQQPNFSDVIDKWGDRTVIQVTRSLTSEDFEQQVELLNALRENRLSSEESGLKILMDNMRQSGCWIKADMIFDLLVEGSVDSIFDDLVSEPGHKTSPVRGQGGEIEIAPAQSHDSIPKGPASKSGEENNTSPAQEQGGENNISSAQRLDGELERGEEKI